MTCTAVTPDQWESLALTLAWGPLLVGVLGWCFMTGASEVVRLVALRIRSQGAREPFAVRAERLERVRWRSVELWQRISDRNHREAERRAGGA